MVSSVDIRYVELLLLMLYGVGLYRIAGSVFAVVKAQAYTQFSKMSLLIANLLHVTDVSVHLL